MSDAEIKRRYPRLLRAMIWVAILSEGEAIGAIQGYQEGREYTSEAVGHYGGASQVIKRACREYTRRFLWDLARHPVHGWSV
jgi:hypothetical protein